SAGSVGVEAVKKACVASPEASPCLHFASAMPLGASCCHVPAPSVVRQMVTVFVWHCVAEEAVLSKSPRVSSTNATSMFASPVGSERSAHVSPRSDERKSRVPPTSAHTTVAEGALICAIEGSEIGVGVGELDAVGVGDGAAVVEVALGVGVGDVAAFGWFEHAARNRARTKTARIGYSVSCRATGGTWRPQRSSRSDSQTHPTGHNYSPTDTNSDAGTALTPHFWRYSSARGRTPLGGVPGIARFGIRLGLARCRDRFGHGKHARPRPWARDRHQRALRRCEGRADRGGPCDRCRG